MISRLITILLMLLSLGSVAQVNTFRLPENRNRISAEFESYDNLVVVEMVLQDSIPVRLIVDSGIEGVILTDTLLVDYFEQHCFRKFKLTAPASTVSLDACITSLVKIRFGKLEPIFTNMILLQEDLFSLESFIGAKVHGLIGIDKFKDLVLTVDYARHYLELTKPLVYKVPKNADVIPIDILRGRPYISARVELDNREIRDLWLMIDSGANHPLLLETDSTDTYQPVNFLETTIGRGLGGNIPGKFVRSGWLMIGNSRLDNIITSLSSDYFTGNPATRNFRDGTLGAGALSRFTVSYDYTGKRLILQKGTKFREPFDYNMSGVVFESINTGFNVYRVAEVIEGSPGQLAGVQKGDILVSVNSKAAFSMNLGELNIMLSKKPGTPVSMLLSREGKVVSVRFKLKRLV